MLDFQANIVKIFVIIEAEQKIGVLIKTSV